MRDITTTVYQYGELSDEAKERARDWFRQASASDSDMFWSESPTEDFQELLKACGWDVDKKRGLHWSGFSSQGDGAAFAGNWRTSLCDPSAWLAERPASYVDSDGKPQTCKHNARYHDAVAEIVALAARYPGASGSVTYAWRGNFIICDSFYFDENAEDDPLPENAHADACEELADAARSLADAFYRTLEAEYDYQNSDEVVAENITCNEYEFTEDGQRA